jgi:protoporphyrinogen oxidase
VQEPLTASEQAVSQTLSSVYKMNLDDLSLQATQKLVSKINDLKSALRWAYRKNREKEANRILDTISKTINEMDYGD